MKRRFVIAAEGLDSAQEQKLKDYIRELGAWWHWIDNIWLLTTSDEDVSTAKIRDQIKQISRSARALVMEVADIDWAGFGKKNKAGKNQHDWLRSTWSTSDEGHNEGE